MDADDDIFVLLEGNAGIAILPRTARRPDCTVAVEIAGLKLERTVFLYEAAGRPRSLAASGLLKLLRSADLLDQAA
jgi:hypothetical protein